jgi:predicted esterase
MKRIYVLLAASSLAVAVGLVEAQKFAPPEVKMPDEAKLKEIRDRSKKLDQRLKLLRGRQLADHELVEVEVFSKAAAWMLRHEEFYSKEAGDWALDALDQGLQRGAQAAQGEAPWRKETGHSVVRAYRSQVDGSIQPYAVTFPADFGQDPEKVWRLDVVLHGRDSGISEVKFIHEHNGEKEAPKGQGFVQLDIFGRGNNAYRWAGETDVVEAVENFLAVEGLLGRARSYDPSKQVLRGFSMGGAGTWHLGMHRPDRWCAIGPGAGFTATHGYVPNLPEKLPAYQEACLHIYDAVDYAENAADVPVIAYAGGNDEQLQAAKNIEARLKPLDIPMTLLVAPGLGHTMPAEWQARAEELYAKYATTGRPPSPERVRFVTYTLKYAVCDWVTILRLKHHYEKATIDAQATDKGFKVKTTNISALALELPPGFTRVTVNVDIDGELIEAPIPAGRRTKASDLRIFLDRRNDRWEAVLPERLLTDRLRRMQKTTDLQGPIDDAFMQPFLCVVGTGKPWHQETGRCAEGSLKQFQQLWDKYLRAELPVKKDEEVTPEDIAGKHLVLFGDPSSNSLVAQVLDGLPLKWNQNEMVFAGKSYSSADHLPVLIHPSPLNTGRYVVLNSGHTFRAADFASTNAMLFPRLGDHAVLRLAPKREDPLAVEVAEAGLFNDFWGLDK